MKSISALSIKMKKLVFLCCVFFIMGACEKYDLDGDKSILVGNWCWAYSRGSYLNIQTESYVYFTVLPEDVDKAYSMEFLENGKYLLKVRSNVIHREKAKFVYWNKIDSINTYEFVIEIKPEVNLSGYVYGDTIMTRQGEPPYYFPTLDEEVVYSYDNYFVRQ